VTSLTLSNRPASLSPGSTAPRPAARSNPIAKEAAPGVRAVIYAPDTMPEFVRGQVDLAVDPAVLSPDVVADELAAAE